MKKSIKGDDLFPGCDFQAETEAELVQKAAAHTASVYGVTELTDEIVAKVKGCIRDGKCTIQHKFLISLTIRVGAPICPLNIVSRKREATLKAAQISREQS